MNATLPPPDTSTQMQPVSPPDPSRMQTGLVRPLTGRRIGGVCAGIADKNGWSRTTVRLVTALSLLLPGPQVIAYLIAWVVIPSEEQHQTTAP